MTRPPESLSHAHVLYVKWLLANLLDRMTPETAARSLKAIERICREQRHTLEVIDPGAAEVDGDTGSGFSDFESSDAVSINPGRRTLAVTGTPNDLTSRMIEEGLTVFRDTLAAQNVQNLTRALIQARESGQSDIVAALEEKFSSSIAPLQRG